MHVQKLHVRMLVQASSACILFLAGSAFAAPSGSLARRAPSATTTTGTTTTTTGTTTTGTTTGPGGCGPGGPGGPNSGRGGAHGTVITGTITAIDTTAGTITVAPTSGTATTIAVTTATVLVGHETISASSIALGDTLEVSGVPLSLQVLSIADDHVNTASSTSTTTTTTTTAPTGTTTTTSHVPGSLRVRGVVTALAPPTITVNDSFALTLSVSSTTTYSEIVTITASQIAVGDSVVAQVSGSSTLTATKLDVTVPSS